MAAAGIDGLGLDVGDKRSGNIAGAILFLAAGTNVMDVYSALNSSPWTSENFGADEEKARSCWEYVMHSVAWTSFYCIVAAWISRSWWPIIGGLIANVYMIWLYRRALERGRKAGSKNWKSA